MRFSFLLLSGFLATTLISFAQTNEDSTAPTLTLQPAGFTGFAGDTVTLAGSAQGSPAPVYQWLRDNFIVPGATSPTLMIANAAVGDTGLYVLVASNVLGSVNTVPVAVIITKRPQTILFTSNATAVPAGSSINVGAISTSSLPVTLSFVSGAGSLSGNRITGAGGDVVIRASQAGDATYDAATVERTFTFVAGGLSPFVTSAPADQTVASGASATFRVSAVGTPTPSYQWQKDGEPISGATRSILAIEAATLANAGRYTVVVGNAMGSVTSAASLFVRSAPVIVKSPENQTVDAGASTRLAVEAAGFPALTYQWRKNGGPVADATGAALVFAAVKNTDAGRYDVVITNELGSVTTAVATLAVNFRDFSGTYFGRFSGGAGNFALFVRLDGTAAFVGHLPQLQTGLAVLDVPVDAAGNFSVATRTLATTAFGADSAALADAEPGRAAAPQAITLRGVLDETTGTLSGSIPELGLSIEGTRAAARGPASAQAGFYSAVLVGSTDGRGYIVVAPDGQAYLFTASGATLDSATGTVSSDGRLRMTGTQAGLDFGFTGGTVTGTVQLPGGVIGTILGVAEDVRRDEHLANISVRSGVVANSTLITGFVVSGRSPKQVLVRAAGPALGLPPFNLPNVLVDPDIQLFRGNNQVAQNDNWGTPQANAAALATAATRSGAFAFRPGSADAALLRTLAPGAYTVVVGGGAGVVLAEVYEVLENNETPATRRLVNLSARGPVTAAAPLIAGFVISGNAPQRVLIRGVGPTLGAAPFNVANALPQPQLTLSRGRTTLRTGADWFRDPDVALIRSAAASVGAFPLGAQSRDAALLVFLAPGSYTAQVTGPAGANNANANGIALVEVYEVAP